MTQKELAQKSDVSFSMVSKLESGEKKNPSFDTLKKIAKALNVSVDELLNGMSEYNKNNVTDDPHNYYDSAILNKAINNIASKIRIEHLDDKMFLIINNQRKEITADLEKKISNLLEMNVDNLINTITILLEEGE